MLCATLAILLLIPTTLPSACMRPVYAGVGEMEAYEADCTFADPFTSFNGVERFKKNVSNLGGLL